MILDVLGFIWSGELSRGTNSFAGREQEALSSGASQREALQVVSDIGLSLSVPPASHRSSPLEAKDTF